MITPKEAIEIIKKMEQIECDCEDCKHRRPALELAIKALGNMGCECGLCLAHNNMECPKVRRDVCNGM